MVGLSAATKYASTAAVSREAASDEGGYQGSVQESMVQVWSGPVSQGEE